MSAGDFFIWYIEYSTTDGGETEEDLYYIRMDIENINPEAAKIFVNYSITEAESDDYSTYGYADDSIWTSGLEPDDDFKYINDTEAESWYKFFFNALEADMSEIDEDLLIGMQLYSNPTILGYFIIIAFSGLGGFEIIEESNSTTINDSGKYYNYHDLAISHNLYSDLSSTWMNMSLTSTTELNYGKTSQVLTKATSTASMTMTTYNDTTMVYDTDTSTISTNMEAVYPSSLVDELEAGSKGLLDSIPGYTPAYIALSAAIGIFMLLRKRK